MSKPSPAATRMGHEISSLAVRWGNSDSVEMNRADLAKVFGVADRNIGKWVDQGMPFVKGSGIGAGNRRMYRVADCVKWRVETDMERAKEFYGVQEPSPEQEEIIQLDEARRRKEVATALQAELTLAKEREQVANIDDLMANFAESLIRVRAKLVSMPSRMSGLLAYLDEAEIEKKMDSDITDILNELSEYDHQYIGNEPEIEEEDI